MIVHQESDEFLKLAGSEDYPHLLEVECEGFGALERSAEVSFAAQAEVVQQAFRRCEAREAGLERKEFLLLRLLAANLAGEVVEPALVLIADVDDLAQALARVAAGQVFMRVGILISRLGALQLA